MKKLVFALLLALAALRLTGAPAEEALIVPAGLEDVPAEAVSLLGREFPGYALEDYIEIPGTPDGDYAFASVALGGARTLACMRRAGERLTLAYINPAALPQGEASIASFAQDTAGVKDWTARGENVWDHDDAWGFTFFFSPPENEEYYEKGVCYHWDGKRFALFSYFDWALFYGETYLEGDGLSFYHQEGAGAYAHITLSVKTDAAKADFAALPKRVWDAGVDLTGLPVVPSGSLPAINVDFAPGQKFPVYTGPRTDYARAADGKAIVSTNGQIDVYGVHDGWAMILYEVGHARCRIGWIDASALPEDARVPELTFLGRDCVLGWPEGLQDEGFSVTDDPLVTGETVCTLPAGTRVTALLDTSDWFYIYCAFELNGEKQCAFVPGNFYGDEDRIVW